MYGGVAAIRDVVKGIKGRLQISRDDDISLEAAWLAEFVERHREKWETSGAKTPIDFLAVLLARREWDSARLRRLLQIDIEEAAKFLEVCGYEYNSQTKLYVLTSASQEKHLRGRLLDEFLGYDPVTWMDDTEP